MWHLDNRSCYRTGFEVCDPWTSVEQVKQCILIHFFPLFWQIFVFLPQVWMEWFRVIHLFGFNFFYVLIKSNDSVQLCLLRCVLRCNNWIERTSVLDMFFFSLLVRTNSAGFAERCIATKMLRINSVKLFEQQSWILAASSAKPTFNWLQLPFFRLWLSEIFPLIAFFLRIASLLEGISCSFDTYNLN